MSRYSKKDVLAIIEELLLSHKQYEKNSKLFSEKTDLNSVMQNIQMNKQILLEALIESAEEAGYKISIDEYGTLIKSNDLIDDV